MQYIIKNLQKRRRELLSRLKDAKGREKSRLIARLVVIDEELEDIRRQKATAVM